MSKTPKKQNKKDKRSVEDKYQKIDHHEHILKRPGMYIGSIKKETTPMWIFNEGVGEGEQQIIRKEIKYVPGLFKIFDEILVNARDHSIQCKSCNKIKVNIDKETGKLTVWNNGNGIPVVEHKKHKILIPSMLFGELLTSTNYDDTQKREVGGTNGLGAKLANIYSSEFIVETLDAKRDLKFCQKFTNNMYTKGEPKVTPGKGKKSYSKFSFIPDYAKFGLHGLTKDIIALFKKRVYDIAMNTNAKVYYNDELINIDSFCKYIDIYFPDGSDHRKVLDISNKKWKVCVVYDPTDTLEHQNISFVNGINTSRGGTHVDHVVNQVVTELKKAIQKRAKKLDVKPAMIKENLIFFIDSIIVNPEFDTQTKEFLKTKVADFGSSYSATDKFIKGILKTGVIEQIIANAQAKAEASLGKNGKKGTVHYAKLYGAHEANTKNGWKCSLILTEGDSAKTFALSGLNVVGRKHHGVFPLRGKLLNVRDAPMDKIAENEEIKAIVKIIGLEYGKVYKSRKGLRYGKILILTDSDVDGSHIKGLIMNFIHRFWPDLMKNEEDDDEFIECLATPIIKATKGKGKKAKMIQFYTLQEYDEWRKENNDGKGWTPKYYKGLGTHKAEEAQACFEDLNEKIIHYYWDKDLTKKKIKKDSESNDDEPITESTYVPKMKNLCDDAMTLAFDKNRADDRKQWLGTYNPSVYIDNSEKKISYYDFIHKELIAFSIYDTQRSVPNLMDGFKPSQRKVFYGSIKKNIYSNEVKVAQLSGYVSEHTHYRHGEQSLNETIIGMAQKYMGSNNINLLLPNGQFGSRLLGGKDAASPRYIFTQLNGLNKRIFINEDFDILQQQYEDNDEIEPLFYAPIIPMVLVNGADGIGTGYSTKVLPCNPRDIYLNLKRILAGEKVKAMAPWYRHFTGTIEKIDKNKFISRANYTIVDDDTIRITDLPIGVWTDNYKEFLANIFTDASAGKKGKKAKTEKAPAKGKAKSKAAKRNAKMAKKSKTAKVAKSNNISEYVKSYTEDCTEIKIDITIKFYPKKLKELIKSGQLETKLKLATNLNNTNMHLFDENGKIKKYKTYGAIIENFSRVRLDLYQKRKDYLLGKWRKEMDILKWKVKFIENVIDGTIVIFRKGTTKKKEEVIARLEELEFPKFITGSEKNPSYGYITSTGLFHLTTEEVDKLKQDLADKKEQIGILEGKMPSQMWEEELGEFMEVYDKWEQSEIEEYDMLMKKKKIGHGSKKRKTNALEAVAE